MVVALTRVAHWRRARPSLCREGLAGSRHRPAAGRLSHRRNGARGQGRGRPPAKLPYDRTADSAQLLGELSELGNPMHGETFNEARESLTGITLLVPRARVRRGTPSPHTRDPDGPGPRRSPQHASFR
jgi:hypothetical protein